MCKVINASNNTTLACCRAWGYTRRGWWVSRVRLLTRRAQPCLLLCVCVCVFWQLLCLGVSLRITLSQGKPPHCCRWLCTLHTLSRHSTRTFFPCTSEGARQKLTNQSIRRTPHCPRPPPPPPLLPAWMRRVPGCECPVFFLGGGFLLAPCRPTPATPRHTIVRPATTFAGGSGPHGGRGGPRRAGKDRSSHQAGVRRHGVVRVGKSGSKGKEEGGRGSFVAVGGKGGARDERRRRAWG